MDNRAKVKEFIMMFGIICAVILLAGCRTPASPEFNPTPSNMSSILTAGLDGNYVKDLLIRGNEIWTATPLGADRWDLDTGTYQKYTAADGLADSYVTSVIQDNQGDLWFGTDKGVSRFDGTHWKTFTTKDGLANDFVTTMAIDKQGNLWFGTYALSTSFAFLSHGVSRYDGHHWRVFTTKDGLPGNDVYTIYGDNQGNVWFGTDGNPVGVTRFDGAHWQTFTHQDGLIEGYVQGIYQDQEGKLWFGTLEGASSFDANHWQTLIPVRPVQNPSVGVIFQDNSGNYWLGGVGGFMSKYDGASWQFFDQLGDILASGNVQAMAQDSQNKLWFATSGGLVRYDGKQWKAFEVNN